MDGNDLPNLINFDVVKKYYAWKKRESKLKIYKGRLRNELLEIKNLQKAIQVKKIIA